MTFPRAEALARQIWSSPMRRGFAFAPRASAAAWVTDAPGGCTIGIVDPGDAAQRPRVIEDERIRQPGLEVAFAGPGSLWAWRCGDGVIEVLAVGPAEAGCPREWRVEPVDELGGMSLRSLPGNQAACGWMVATCEDETSTILRPAQSGTALLPVARLPFVTTGGAWLEGGRHLALNVRDAAGRLSGYVLDVVDGTYHLLFEVSRDSDDCIVACHEGTGRLVVTSDVFGYRRIGLGDAGGVIRFLPDIYEGVDSAEPRGLSPDGNQLLIAHQAGVSGRLWMADTTEMSLRGPLGIPDGQAGCPAAWAGEWVRFPFSSPTQPYTLAGWHPREGFRVHEASRAAAFARVEPAKARSVLFEGPRGPIEALAYRRAPSRPLDPVLVALHGGPIDQWDAAFSPALQLLAGLAGTVVAVNYTGSTGYGQDSIRALFGHSGRVDAADVIAVLESLQRPEGWGGRPVVLYGESYGAFLALLVAARRPELCAGVIALSPFTSPAGLRAGASAQVRHLLDLIGGPPQEGEGRDFIMQRLSCRALIAHGALDRSIPVTQSRALVRGLAQRGFVWGRDLRYVEFPGDGHVLRSEGALGTIAVEIEAFLQEITGASGGLAGRGGWVTCTDRTFRSGIEGRKEVIPWK